ncbi:ABC transporter substrate-binding protein [Leucobacter triazinivorans]|uniref:Thiamine pyrimidine synthase n=1 Tax=Leucobacter triazinivorans TaxID=1784719 RepID=A0A4P6KHT5_9MICO|nr:ABC transporter substrate-binding protein [Leucobacter triazinivorans]QBE49863.1 ABC transporter substrate-binding protein [Leucobacter triazinivorans]
MRHHIITHARTAHQAGTGALRSVLRRVVTAGAAILAGSLALTACAGAAPADDAAAHDELTPVSFALDWAPNTNHIGVYVADELGYFAEVGLDVEILPYGSTSAVQLVSAGEADFGIGGQSGVQMARTAGLDVMSVYRVTQTDTGRLVTLGDREDLTRPADLDGLVFGGFGAPLYSALAASTIRGDGGQGEFEEVVLDTGAYEALSQGRIDFTLSVSTWEDLQTQIDGHPYRTFRYQDFGVPEQQSTGIVSSESYLEAHSEDATAFVQAVARGYAYAADHPEEAADLLIAANPDTLGTAEELVHRSAELMAGDGYLVSEERPIGAADPEAWEGFGAFLFDGGFLTDSEGRPLAEEPDWTEYYTDEYL